MRATSRSLSGRHGTQLEPAARAAYERQSGPVMQPLVLVDGQYSASLDGITLAGERVLEIKCPHKGRNSTLWKSIEAGRLPEHYYWKVQHQLMVSKADVANVFVFDGNDGIAFPLAPEPSRWPRIHEAWDGFMRCVTESEAPPLTDRDTRLRDDPEWLEAAAAYLELMPAHDEPSAKLDAAKARLIAQATHAKEQGGGVSVTRHWNNGAIDYKKIPELKALDLGQYRAAAREETRVTTR